STANHNEKCIEGDWNPGDCFLPSGKPRELLFVSRFRRRTLSWPYQLRQAMSFVPLRSASCIPDEIKVTLSNSVRIDRHLFLLRFSCLLMGKYLHVFEKIHSRPSALLRTGLTRDGE